MNLKKNNKIRQNIEYIKNHKDTRLVKYPEYKEAYEFVDKKFPEANIKNIKFYICSRKALDKVNYGFVYGLYCSFLKTIIIVDEERSKKEVKISIIHELLHYASDIVNNFCSRKRKNEEEFVLANLIDYFLSKKYNNEDIVNYIYNNLKCKDIEEARKFFKKNRNKTNKIKRFRVL